MIILFIIGLILGGGAVVFALQNTEIITVSFFSWQLTGSLSLIILLAMLAGALTAILLFLPGSIRASFKHRRLKKENLKLGDELEKQKEKTIFARTAPPTEENIARIEDGAIDDSTR